MNNDYCLQSYRNYYQGEGDGAGGGAGDGAGANKLYWYQKTRIFKVITNPMFFCMFNYIYRYYCCNILELYSP